MASIVNKIGENRLRWLRCIIILKHDIMFVEDKRERGRPEK